MSVAAERSAVRTVARAWQSVPLRELCEFYNGLWKGKKGPFETATVIRNTNFTSDGRIDLTNVAVLDVESRQLAKRRLKRNDIIIEKSGGGPKQPVGRVVLFDLDTGDAYSFSNFTSVIRVADAKVVDPVYLHRVLYWWYTSGRTESIQSHSTGIRNLDFNAYKELSVPLPPLEEQKRIVAVLDQAFAALDRARAHAEANLADAQSLFVASIRQRFESDVAEFGSVDLNAFAEHVTDGDHQPPPKVATGVPFITISNIDKVSRCIGFSDTFYVSEEYFQRLNDKRRAKSGDILYTVTGSFGIPVLVSEECGDFCFQRHIGLIRPKPSVNSKWLSYMLGCPQVYEQADDGATGTAQRTVSLKVLRRLQVPNAPESKQRAAVRELDVLSDRCRTLASFYQSKLAGLAALRQSLLQKAFAGELT